MHSRGRRTVVATVIALAALLGGARGVPVALAAHVAHGCDLVDASTGRRLARFPGPITVVTDAEAGAPIELLLWGLPLAWTPGTPLPTRGPILPAACAKGAVS